MTYIAPAEYALPFDIKRCSELGCPEVDPADINVVVPVKDDRVGLLRILRSLLRLRVPPRHIRIVDDGSDPPIRLHGLNGEATAVSVVRLPRNRGPAAARNAGVSSLYGWIYLTDCGCEHPADMFEHLARVRSSAPDDIVGETNACLCDDTKHPCCDIAVIKDDITFQHGTTGTCLDCDPQQAGLCKPSGEPWQGVVVAECDN